MELFAYMQQTHICNHKQTSGKSEVHQNILATFMTYGKRAKIIDNYFKRNNGCQMVYIIACGMFSLAFSFC